MSEPTQPTQPTQPRSEPRMSAADLAYVRAEYLPLDELCSAHGRQVEQARELIDQRVLPRATYRLPDGTEMFPPDYFELLDEAGDPARLRTEFEQRHAIAVSTLGLTGVDAREDWAGYLSGEFGACLREVTPETIVEKGALIAQIEALVAAPRPGDATWTAQLGEAVDDLDELERPFTDYDRQRWGGGSRDKHIATVRARFLQ
ncbi:MAG: DUF6058 family natural product biosynthesis protein [Nocardioidaceae bacterium]